MKLNIAGRVDPAFDKDGYREASLEHSIQALRHKDEGDSADANAKNAALSTADYNKYLGQVYGAGKFKKPRDVIGFAKTIPPDQMKKLILANTAVSDQDLQHLAGGARKRGARVSEHETSGCGADVHNRAEAGRRRNQGSGQDDARRSIAGVISSGR